MVRLLALVDRFPSRRVAVVGDLLADEFIYGRVERVSREAPVLILRVRQTIVVPGGAGNAANNVAALGARVGWRVRRPRRAGRRLLDACRSASSRTRCSAPAAYHTPVKTRILAGGVHSAKQQVVRIDRITHRRTRRGDARGAFGRACSPSPDGSMPCSCPTTGRGLVTPGSSRV